MRKILPFLLSFLTGERHLVSFYWSERSWVDRGYNIFYFVFGRKRGIRRFMASGVVEVEGRLLEVQKFYCLHALLMHIEHRIRTFHLPIPRLVWVPVPQFATPNGVPVPFGNFPYLLAIATDAVGNGLAGTTGTSYSWSHTVASGAVLFAMGKSGQLTVTADYNGTSMTAPQTAQTFNAGAFGTANAWYLLTPSSGTNNVTLSNVSSTTLSGYSESLTGASTSAITGSTASTTVSSSFDITVSGVTAANGWILAGSGTNGDQGVGANTTDRSSPAQYLFDSNGIAVSDKISLTRTGGTTSGYVGIGFSQAVAPSGPTNLKSLDGNVKANIKSYNGNVLANIKSISGNS